MSREARETGLAREALYRALTSDRSPELATIVRGDKDAGAAILGVKEG